MLWNLTDRNGLIGIAFGYGKNCSTGPGESERFNIDWGFEQRYHIACGTWKIQKGAVLCKCILVLSISYSINAIFHSGMLSAR